MRQWDVEDVVAHLTAAASLNQWRWVRSMLGARFRVDTHNQRRMVEQRGNTPAETLYRFRAVLGSTTAASGTLRPTSARLSCTPKTSVSRSECRRRQTSTPSHPWLPSSLVAISRLPRTAVAGLQLRADDGPFATGTGSLVTGSTLALVMSMAGRAEYVDYLDGPGVSTLRARVHGTAT